MRFRGVRPDEFTYNTAIGAFAKVCMYLCVCVSVFWLCVCGGGDRYVCIYVCVYVLVVCVGVGDGLDE
jgi:hypothetical protein